MDKTSALWASFEPSNTYLITGELREQCSLPADDLFSSATWHGRALQSLLSSLECPDMKRIPKLKEYIYIYIPMDPSTFLGSVWGMI